MKFIVILCFLFSFNAISSNDFIKFKTSHTYEEGDKKLTENDYGSGARWNNDYVVTAKHVNFVEDSVYICSKNCDIRFIKMKSLSKNTTKWREPYANENVTIIGSSIGGDTVITKGKDLNLEYYVVNDKIESYPEKKEQKNALVYTSTAQVIEGQSGGPVYSDDGYIIGIVIGHTILTPKVGDKFSVSVYIPYSIIKKEWEKFNKKGIN